MELVNMTSSIVGFQLSLTFFFEPVLFHSTQQREQKASTAAVTIILGPDAPAVRLNDVPAYR